MSNTTDKAMREAFEAWLQSPECPITAGSRMTSASARVDETWQTWKAALASSAAEAEPHGWLYEDEMGEQVFVPGKIAPSWPWKKPAMTAVYTRPSAPLSEPTAEGVKAEANRLHAVLPWCIPREEINLQAVARLALAALSSPASSAQQGEPAVHALLRERNALLSLIGDVVAAGHMDQEHLARLRSILRANGTPEEAQ